jgi:hypothetical protein
MLFPTLKPLVDEDLGRLLLEWDHEPTKGQKLFQRLLWLSVLVFLILLALSPFLRFFGDAIGGAVVYALIVILSSLLPRLWRKQVPHHYELHDKGLLIHAVTGKDKDPARFALWSDFKDVLRQEKGVKLVPRYFIQQPVVLPTGPRRFDVYFICREKVWESNFQRMVRRPPRVATR